MILRPQRPGFSLIELVVVLVLMGALASAAAFSLRGVVLRGRLTRAVEVVEQFDRALRRAARSQRRYIAGELSRTEGRLTVVGAQGDPALVFRIPKQVRIEAIRFSAAPSNRQAYQIAAADSGATGTYAVQLACGDAKRWVAFAGGSGQVFYPQDTAAVRLLLGSR